METSEIAFPDLPWLASELAALRAARAGGRLSHAILVHAAAGTGGDWLAAWIARLALCSAAPAEAPCGRCVDCRRVLELKHPDLSVATLEEESRQIRIEQVRDLASELALTSHQGHGKVAILTPADALNRFAANALLKTLEEPPPGTVLVLVSEQPSRLPATVRSRCQRVRVPVPSRAASREWLQKNAGQGTWDAVLDFIGEAPLAAARTNPKQLAELTSEVDRTLAEALAARCDVVATAERWSRSELVLRLGATERWLTERIRAASDPSGRASELRRGAHLPAAPPLLNIRALFGLLDGVRELRSLADTPLNKSLALEVLLRGFADVRGSATQERAGHTR